MVSSYQVVHGVATVVQQSVPHSGGFLVWCGMLLLVTRGCRVTFVGFDIYVGMLVVAVSEGMVCLRSVSMSQSDQTECCGVDVPIRSTGCLAVFSSFLFFT